MKSPVAVLCVLFSCSSVLGQWDLSTLEDPTLGGQPPPAILAPTSGGTGVSAPQKVTVFVSTNGSKGLDYCAVLLDKTGPVVPGLFVKVQSKCGFDQFCTAGFYQGNNGGGWPGMTGGAAYPTLPVWFSEAVITVEHDGAGNVTLHCPGGPLSRGGWTPLGGSRTGLGFFHAESRMDDFRSGASMCDRFNRPDGPIGNGWVLVNGVLNVSENRAMGGPEPGSSMAVFMADCAAPCSDREAIKEAKCKKDKLKVKTSGGNPGEIVAVSAACGSNSATIKANGTATVTVKPCSGSGTATANWACGASASRPYKCVP